jgi:hypothetical protein
MLSTLNGGQNHSHAPVIGKNSSITVKDNQIIPLVNGFMFGM